MAKEEVALKVQMKKNNKSYSSTPAYNPAPTKSFNRKRGSDFFDDDEDYEKSYQRSPVGIDLSMTLFLFVIFLVTDLIGLVFMANGFFGFLPIIVHGVFLPVLFTIVYKQKKGDYPPRIIVTYLKIVIAYMIVYMIVKSIVALLPPYIDVLSLVITLVIGGFMIYVYNRLLQQVKYMF